MNTDVIDKIRDFVKTGRIANSRVTSQEASALLDCMRNEIISLIAGKGSSIGLTSAADITGFMNAKAHYDAKDFNNRAEAALAKKPSPAPKQITQTAGIPIKPKPAASMQTPPATTSPNAVAFAVALLDEQERRAAAKTKTMAQFRALDPYEKSAFFKAGGKLVD